MVILRKLVEGCNKSIASSIRLRNIIPKGRTDTTFVQESYTSQIYQRF